MNDMNWASASFWSVVAVCVTIIVVKVLDVIVSLSEDPTEDPAEKTQETLTSGSHPG